MFLTLANKVQINSSKTCNRIPGSLNDDKHTNLNTRKESSEACRRALFPKGCGIEKKRYDTTNKISDKCKISDTGANDASKNKKQVCIWGSGNWGSSISKIIGVNTARLPQYEDCVSMHVIEEKVNGKFLHEIINETHENVKYLPGHKLPENIYAMTDLVEVTKDADIIVNVLPHEFVEESCKKLVGKVKKSATVISLSKGVVKDKDGGIDLISQIITRSLKLPCAVLMGANLAQEVAAGKFGETTIGCSDFKNAHLLKDLFQSDDFKVSLIDDAITVELCGALKNIVACGTGFINGMKGGNNTKSAVIRLGLMEMISFVEEFYPGGKLPTYFESCGIADLITTCYGGRNSKVAEAFVTTGKTMKELETELLKGQKLQGPSTAMKVYSMLKQKGIVDKFPIFAVIHKICIKESKPEELITCMRNHPDLKRNKLEQKSSDSKSKTKKKIV